MKKFDVVFSNPPYNGNLDLKILKSLFEHTVAENIIVIHPSNYLLDKKFKTKLYNDIRNTNYLESVYLFWGNKLFDILLFCPCCISIWNMNKTSDKCIVTNNIISKLYYTCKINDISIHGKYFNSIKLFLKCKNNLLTNLTCANKLTDYSVKFAQIRGHANNEDFFTLICKDSNENKCDHTFRFPAHVHKTQCLHWAFNNEDERKNFINYCKTKIVRFLLSLIKTNGSLARGELKVIPWMDFTQEWNDKKLCKEFNISNELWQYIDNFIPDYYDDYDFE